MTTKKAVFADMAIPPGETLREELDARGMTQRRLAEQIGRPPQVVNEIVRGRKAITAETALALEDAFGGPPAMFWLNLQSRYDLTLAKLRRERRSA